MIWLCLTKSSSFKCRYYVCLGRDGNGCQVVFWAIQKHGCLSAHNTCWTLMTCKDISNFTVWDPCFKNFQHVILLVEVLVSWLQTQLIFRGSSTCSSPCSILSLLFIIHDQITKKKAFIPKKKKGSSKNLYLCCDKTEIYAECRWLLTLSEVSKLHKTAPDKTEWTLSKLQK